MGWQSWMAASSFCPEILRVCAAGRACCTGSLSARATQCNMLDQQHKLAKSQDKTKTLPSSFAKPCRVAEGRDFGPEASNLHADMAASSFCPEILRVCAAG